MRSCPEDPAVCIPVKYYCDGIAQCPEAGDEAQSGCICEDRGLQSCHDNGHGQIKCLNTNWASAESPTNSEFECQAILHSLNGAPKKESVSFR